MPRPRAADLLLILAAPLAACSGGEATGGIDVSAAALTEPLLGDQSALYLTATNLGDAADALLGLEVDGVGAATLHRSVTDGGRMTMAAADSLVVEPHGELRLRPGGAHGMLEGIRSTWTAGDTVRVRLRFRTAGTIELAAPVVGYAEIETLFPAGGG